MGNIHKLFGKTQVTRAERAAQQLVSAAFAEEQVQSPAPTSGTSHLSLQPPVAMRPHTHTGTHTTRNKQ